MFKNFPYILLLCIAPAIGAQENPLLKVDIPDSVDQKNVYVFTHRAMGTEFSVTIYDEKDEFAWDGAYAIAEAAFSKVDTLERNISSWIPTSNTSEINRLADSQWVDATPAVWNLFQFSARLNKDTGGAFDITVGPLIDFWRDALLNDKEPDLLLLPPIKNKVGMEKVEFNSRKRKIRFKRRGMHVSFGGVGKGLAIDKVVEVFKTYGVKAALISGGDSSIYAMGAPPGQDFWRIGIHNPYNNSANLDMVLLRDEALSTSACYHHEPDAIHGKPCEILDPHTGHQVKGMLSATIIAPNGMLTDALSTSFYVMGVKQVKSYIEKHPNIRAIIVEYPEDGIPKPVRSGSFRTESDKGH
jgi:thiamine biosynthesis lipoprotein